MISLKNLRKRRDNYFGIFVTASIILGLILLTPIEAFSAFSLQYPTVDNYQFPNSRDFPFLYALLLHGLTFITIFHTLAFCVEFYVQATKKHDCSSEGGRGCVAEGKLRSLEMWVETRDIREKGLKRRREEAILQDIETRLQAVQRKLGTLTKENESLKEFQREAKRSGKTREEAQRIVQVIRQEKSRIRAREEDLAAGKERLWQKQKVVYEREAESRDRQRELTDKENAVEWMRKKEQLRLKLMAEAIQQRWLEMGAKYRKWHEKGYESTYGPTEESTAPAQ